MAKFERMAKGTNMLPLVKLVRKTLNERGELPLDSEDVEFITGQILLSNWYPFDRFLRILHFVHAQILDGSDEAARQLGDAAANEALQDFQQAFLARNNPLLTIERLTRIWALYFNFGSLVAGRISPDRAVLRLTEYPEMSRCHANVLIGWLRTAIHLAGGEFGNLRIDRATWRGDRELYCTFSWLPGQK